MPTKIAVIMKPPRFVESRVCFNKSASCFDTVKQIIIVEFSNLTISSFVNAFRSPTSAHCTGHTHLKADARSRLFRSPEATFCSICMHTQSARCAPIKNAATAAEFCSHEKKTHRAGEICTNTRKRYQVPRTVA